MPPRLVGAGGGESLGPAALVPAALVVLLVEYLAKELRAGVIMLQLTTLATCVLIALWVSTADR